MARAPKADDRAAEAATVEVVALVTLVVGAGADVVSYAPGERTLLPAPEAARLAASGFAAGVALG